MTARRSRAPILMAAALGLWAFTAGAQDAANQSLRAGIAEKVTAARQANAAAMQQYTWDQRTELLEDGTVKDTRVEMLNWVNGQYQKSLVSNEGPSLPRFGIRKRIAEGKQKDMQEYLSGLKAQLEQYTMGTSPQLLAFFNKAQVSGPDATGLIALSGGSVVSPGDSMTLWVNATTHKAAKAFVSTTYQGNPVTMNATFNVLAAGLSYMNYADIQIPSKQMEVQVSNFNYNRNN
ncbi:MAG TPA: hypothetical protein VMN82_17400 [Thermoanaerobaculia bacterium]|nr:hypothetical protein [Thermoanaerobaculia bacterium]